MNNPCIRLTSLSVSRVIKCRAVGQPSFFSRSPRNAATATAREEYDYIVVGAGSAGCVVAHRLVTGDKSLRVLLTEAGPPLDQDWKVRMPGGMIMLWLNPKFDWCFQSEPQKNLNGKRLPIPRGRMLGGTSSLNAMIYIRGHPADYNRWAETEGATGWSYADCLPYFKKSQNHELGANEYRGNSGPLFVSRSTINTPLHHAFITAGIQAGYQQTDDFNGKQQEGFGCTAAMYLRPAMKQAGRRLTVLPDTLVSRVVFNGRRAVGIECRTGGKGNTVKQISASREDKRRFAKYIALSGPSLIDNMWRTTGAKLCGKRWWERCWELTASNLCVQLLTVADLPCFIAGEGFACSSIHESCVPASFLPMVILCGGVINSPQLLLLSGVGPADDLRQHDIPVVQNLPGVGTNYQDHLYAPIAYRCTQPLPGFSNKWSDLLKASLSVLKWRLLSRGTMSTVGSGAGAFIRSRADVKHPDLQYMFGEIGWTDNAKTLFNFDAFMPHGFILRPTSRGSITLKSPDPTQPPVIQPNHLDTQEDVDSMRNLMKIGRQVISQRAFDLYRGEEVLPGKHVQTDEEIDEYVRQRAVPFYHPTSTCSMGSPDKNSMAVVDTACRVVGVEGLRVVDASVMPSLVSGNTNAAIIMIAEKVCDAILGRSSSHADR